MSEQNKKENICPVCGKRYDYALTVTYNPDGTKTCEHDVIRAKGKQQTQRHANEEASVVALRLAAEARAGDRAIGEGKMIPVTSTQEGKNKGKTEMIPEKVVESILQKVGPEVATLEE